MFVQVAGTSDGVGKLSEVRGSEAVIEYFVSPAGPRVKRVRVPRKLVHPAPLSTQTRVFWLDPHHGSWRAARVDGVLIDARALKESQDHLPLKFPNGVSARVPVSEVFVRWAHEVDDPIDYLAARITDSPFLFEGRSGIVRSIAGQRASFGGLTALASSAIELLEHQVTTVRRVLTDPVQRYLLADEVGLGKTIEAGILIRQHVIDEPGDAKVVVVVPEHLKAQWQSELSAKFYVADTSPVVVLSEPEFLTSKLVPQDHTMLVVDEAHHAALSAFGSGDPRKLFDKLAEFARCVPRVLLLSGTPVLHQEDGFLAMLHLIDPPAYPLGDREAFRLRVRERQGIAEATADITEDASSLFVTQALEHLEATLPHDQRLMKLCEDVRSKANAPLTDEERRSSLRALRVHLVETYRLHRRMLRTRRDDPRVRDQLPTRTGAQVVHHEDHQRREAFDFVESWRARVPRSISDERAADLQQLTAIWVDAALSHPNVLIKRMETRLGALQNSGRAPFTANSMCLRTPRAFEGEEQFLRERIALISGAVDADSRSLALVMWLAENPGAKKCIVFVDDSTVADAVHTELSKRLGPNGVLRHVTAARSEKTFQENPGIRVLVCDSSAEEGLNLQRVGATVIHYDLPLAPARLEQRLGRVDRVEAKGKMRNVVFSADCPYESQWLACLADPIQLFERTVAPLQYALMESAARIRANILGSGYSAIDDEAQRLRDPRAGLEAELRRVRAQESLDSIEGDPEEDARLFEQLIAADEHAETTGAAEFNGWVERRLQFSRRADAGAFRYVHMSAGGKPTLVPLFDAAFRFGRCIDMTPGARTGRHDLPFRPVTFERASAEKSCAELLRVGHPFVDEMARLVAADDRGTSFTMWRHVPTWRGSDPALFFRFEFVAEMDLECANTVLGKQGSKEALRRRGDEAFPVLYRTVWLDAELAQVNDPAYLSLLSLPYSKYPRDDGSVDVNVRVGRWEDFDRLLPVADWSLLCGRARAEAEAALKSSDGFRSVCSQRAAAIRRREQLAQDVLASRIANLLGASKQEEVAAIEAEARISEALAQGAECPRVRLDSVGVVVLSSKPFAVREQ